MRIALSVIWRATGYTLDYAFEKREETSAALAAWRKENTLTSEQVEELLTQAEGHFR